MRRGERERKEGEGGIDTLGRNLCQMHMKGVLKCMHLSMLGIYVGI